MKPIPVPNATRRIGAPENWDHEQQGICHTIEVADVDGWMITAWQPTAIELEAILNGSPVFLMVYGSVHPVVSLFTTAAGE